MTVVTKCDHCGRTVGRNHWVVNVRGGSTVNSFDLCEECVVELREFMRVDARACAARAAREAEAQAVEAVQ